MSPTAATVKVELVDVLAGAAVLMLGASSTTRVGSEGAGSGAAEGVCVGDPQAASSTDALVKAAHLSGSRLVLIDPPV
jgi:hypothetical protein